MANDDHQVDNTTAKQTQDAQHFRDATQVAIDTLHAKDATEHHEDKRALAEHHEDALDKYHHDERELAKKNRDQAHDRLHEADFIERHMPEPKGLADAFKAYFVTPTKLLFDGKKHKHSKGQKVDHIFGNKDIVVAPVLPVAAKDLFTPQYPMEFIAGPVDTAPAVEPNMAGLLEVTDVAQSMVDLDAPPVNTIIMSEHGLMSQSGAQISDVGSSDGVMMVNGSAVALSDIEAAGVELKNNLALLMDGVETTSMLTLNEQGETTVYINWRDGDIYGTMRALVTQGPPSEEFPEGPIQVSIDHKIFDNANAQVPFQHFNTFKEYSSGYDVLGQLPPYMSLEKDAAIENIKADRLKVATEGLDLPELRRHTTMPTDSSEVTEDALKEHGVVKADAEIDNNAKLKKPKSTEIESGVGGV